MSRSWLIVPLLLLYVLHLGGVGFLGPDEPRYASIGRDMAVTGDWITPRLNAQPWFEKPPLTYWLTALGHLAHLPDEWAARLPEALISVAFLIFFYATLAREFTPRLALAATSILATSAGWMAYSFAALTDLPMSAALGAAILIAVFDDRRALLAGAFLGLSILGKGFVPVVLFAPVLLITRKRFHILAAAVIVAAPWFILCWLRNGPAFWDDFFWKQHVARFLTPSLEHVQPIWYYIPVLLAGLFPWTPLAALLARRQLYTDRRLLLLALWLLYGLLFFSIARNKLPGYLLPLLPGVAILLAAAWESARSKTIWLAVSAVLLIALPTVTAILPDALLSGLTRTHVAFAPAGLLFLAPTIVVWMLSKKPEHALLTVALAAALGVVYLKYTTFPALDTAVSVRNFWRLNQGAASTACVDNVSRTLQYGLNYYAAHELPSCAADARSSRITTQDHHLIVEVAQHSALPQQIAALAATAKGKVSVACSLPGTTLDCDLNPASKPPMQSVFKLPLALMALHLVEQKKLSLDQPVRFRREDRIPNAYSPLQDKYPEAEVDVPLRELLSMAVSLSDNAAADIVLRIVGGPSALNQYLKSLGISGFHIEDNEAGLHRDVTAQYRNWFQPQAAVQLLRRLVDNPPLAREHMDLLLGWMRDTPRGVNRIKGALPPGIMVMHKPGTSGTDNGIAHATNDIGLILLPDGRYLAIAVFVTDSSAGESTRDASISKIARAAYEAAITSAR